MGAGGHGGPHQPVPGDREGPGAVDHHACVGEQRAQAGLVVERHRPDGRIVAGGQPAELAGIAAAEHVRRAAPPELRGDEPAGVPGCAVQDDRHGRDDTVALVRIGDVMTQGVVTADSDDSLHRVGELMRDRNVGSVVVCERGRPVGVITDRDLALVVVADGVEAGERVGAPRLAAARDR